MKVSIIMPVYNKERYLEKSITSILNQTYKDFELVIINDGSTDNSAKICYKFQREDLRIKVIDIENNGVSNARNIGLSEVTGEYIQFIDADDYIDKNMIEDLVVLSKKYNIDIIITSLKSVNLKSNIITEVLLPFEGIVNIDEMMSNFAKVQHETGLYGCISNKFIKKSIIDKYNLRFNNELWLAEDLDFYLKLYNYIENVYFCNKSYYYYVQETDNSSTICTKKHDYLKQIEIILKEKKLLMLKNALNENNLFIVNTVITNFIISYIHQKFDYNFTIFEKYLDMIVRNDSYMKSIVIDNSNKFENRIMKLLLKDRKILIYILFFIRTLLRNIYRKVRR